jgi:hypothetical protein
MEKVLNFNCKSNDIGSGGIVNQKRRITVLGGRNSVRNCRKGEGV